MIETLNSVSLLLLLLPLYIINHIYIFLLLLLFLFYFIFSATQTSTIRIVRKTTPKGLVSAKGSEISLDMWIKSTSRNTKWQSYLIAQPSMSPRIRHHIQRCGPLSSMAHVSPPYRICDLHKACPWNTTIFPKSKRFLGHHSSPVAHECSNICSNLWVSTGALLSIQAWISWVSYFKTLLSCQVVVIWGNIYFIHCVGVLLFIFFILGQTNINNKNCSKTAPTSSSSS